MQKKEWPLWEVFIRSRNGLDHKHCGSVHAPDATMALQVARGIMADDRRIVCTTEVARVRSTRKRHSPGSSGQWQTRSDLAADVRRWTRMESGLGQFGIQSPETRIHNSG